MQATTMSTSAKPRFADRDLQTCPFSAYAEIERQGGVYHDDSTGCYVVTNYDLVKKLAANSRDLLNQTGIFGVREVPWKQEVDAIYAARGISLHDVLVSADGPEHAFQRSLIDKVFSPARVAKMSTYLEDIIDDYVDAFIDDGKVDFNRAVSLMVPMTVIADQLGVPYTPDDINSFKRWSDAVKFRSEPTVTREEELGYAHDICDLQQFLIREADTFRACPQDKLLSDLVHADVNGRKLTLEELVSMAIIILVAGNETTTNAMSSGMHRLVVDLPLQHRLRADPGLVSDFVEECLRIDAPLQGIFRRTSVSMEIGGVAVPENSILDLRWGAANHDPVKFTCPGNLQINRPNVRQHVTFGSGPHFCVGNQLARQELQLVFKHVLRRTTEIRPANVSNFAVRDPHYITFGFKELWIEFDKA